MAAILGTRGKECARTRRMLQTRRLSAAKAIEGYKVEMRRISQQKIISFLDAKSHLHLVTRLCI